MVTILKGEVPEARASLVGPVRHADPIEVPDWWTFDLVREWLIEAVLLWRRSPGGGRPPFATDGPWIQMTRETAAGDYDARGTDGKSSDVQLRGGSLDTAEVELRDMVSEWLAFVPDPQAVTVLRMALGYLASGRRNVPWLKIMQHLGMKRGKGRIERQYRDAIRSICEGLNAAASRR